MKRIIVVVLLLLVVAVGTVQWWGSCDLKARRCTTWCDIKYFNNDSKAAGCRASCSLENASCHGNEAAKGFNDFMNGLKGR
jgi:hypothetical protein